MANLILFAILIAISLLLLITALVKLHNYLIRRLPPSDSGGNYDEEDGSYYDENGNHIYYDRKLIARLEKERQRETEIKTE